MQAWKAADEQMKKPIEQEIFAMLDVDAEEMAAIAKIVEANLPSVPATEPDDDE